MSFKGQREQASQVTRSEALGPLLRRASPTGLLLATDYDGTLSPIVLDPADASPLPESKQALAQLLEAGVSVAIVSARSEPDLRRFLPLPGLRFRGDYGLGTPTEEERAQLAEFERSAEVALLGQQEVQLEPKSGSVSLHFRGHPEAAEWAEALARRLADPTALQVSRGRMVIEVRPVRAGKDKALAGLLAELAPEALIFGGDDHADGPAFDLVAASSLPHLAVGVASPEVPTELFRSCDLVLDGPLEFSQFLCELAAWANRPGP